MLVNGDIFHGDHHPVSVVQGRKSRNLSGFNKELLTLADVGKDGDFMPWEGPSLFFSGIADSDTKTGWLQVSCAYYDEDKNLLGTNGYAGLADGVKKWGRWFNGSGANVDMSKVRYFRFRYVGKYREADNPCNTLTLDKLFVGFTTDHYNHIGYEPYGIVTDTIFTPTLLKKSGQTLTFERSYNHTAEVEAVGKSEQDTFSGKQLFPFDDYTDGHVFGHDVHMNRCGFEVVDGAIRIFKDESHSSDSGDTAWSFYTRSDRMFNLPSNTDMYICGEYKSNYKAALQIGSSATYSTYLLGSDGNRAMPDSTAYLEVSSEWKEFSLKVKTNSSSKYSLRIACDSPNVPLGGETLIRNISITLDGNLPEEPYVGGIPSPNPDYPQPITSIENPVITSRGRNLVSVSHKKASMQINSSYYNDVVAGVSSGFRLLNRVELEAGKGYTIAMKVVSDVEPFNISVGAGTGQFQRDVASVVGRTNGWNYFYFIPTEAQLSVGNVMALRPCRYATRQDIVNYTVEKVMLIEGNVSPAENDYEPYHSVTRTIDLQGNQLRSLPDGTHDTLVVKRTGECWIEKQCVVVRGENETWFRNTDFGTYMRVTCTPSVGTRSQERYMKTAEIMSDTFISSGTMNIEVDGTCFAYTNNRIFANIHASIPNAATLAAWMSEHKPMFICALATPQTITLPPIDPLPTYWPTTVIYDQDGNDISAFVKVID